MKLTTFDEGNYHQERVKIDFTELAWPCVLYHNKEDTHTHGISHA